LGKTCYLNAALQMCPSIPKMSRVISNSRPEVAMASLEGSSSNTWQRGGDVGGNEDEVEDVLIGDSVSNKPKQLTEISAKDIARSFPELQSLLTDIMDGKKKSVNPDSYVGALNLKRNLPEDSHECWMKLLFPIFHCHDLAEHFKFGVRQTLTAVNNAAITKSSTEEWFELRLPIGADR